MAPLLSSASMRMLAVKTRIGIGLVLISASILVRKMRILAGRLVVAVARVAGTGIGVAKREAWRLERRSSVRRVLWAISSAVDDFELLASISVVVELAVLLAAPTPAIIIAMLSLV